jgi:single-strand DNA-binding protein
MINQFTGVGRLTADSELKYTSNGQTVAKFSLCVNDSYKKDGAWQERPYFFNCVVWGKYAEAMNPHLTKGRLIGVIGKLTHNPWKDGNGTNHNDCAIVVSSIHLFPRPGAGSNNPQTDNHPEPEAPPPNADGFTDEIPF